ncbi:integrase core domain-containing protein [Nocardia brevicatena]|uniref:integrase core domain-containing protein n=1 Tax=Nocardia brevicatena TaxID=37327 RepID=UPI001C3F2FEE|nr:integrase core domain-containing protein [Nocardia brevicatena]
MRRFGLRGPMGQVGACADNAAMESFFGLLQKNVLNQHFWGIREQFRLATVHWIEARYHRRRRQRRLGKLTPVEEGHAHDRALPQCRGHGRRIEIGDPAPQHDEAAPPSGTQTHRAGANLVRRESGAPQRQLAGRQGAVGHPIRQFHGASPVGRALSAT